MKTKIAILASILAAVCLCGTDVTKANADTISQTKTKAEQGDAEAQHAVGFFYHYGTGGIGKDDAEAFKWYLKAAEQGLAEAQNQVGYCYRVGEGVVKNYAEAMKWFLKAAEQGSANGQELVGDMYSEGQGVAKNHAVAFNWKLKAALNWQDGLNMCQVRRTIADAFYEGDGVAKNLIEAYAWFSVVAERVKYKYEEGPSYLDPAKYPRAAEMRDKLEKSFTPKEIALAQARALELSAQVSAIDKEGAAKAKR